MVAGFWDGFKDARLETMPKPLRDFDLRMNGPQHLQQMLNQDLKHIAEFHDWPDEALTRIAAPGNHGDFLGQLEVRRQSSPTPVTVMKLVEAFLDQ